MDGSEGTPDLFLSYARPDRATAEAVLRILEDAGHSVWWDAMIPGGHRFHAVISEALERARVVVVLWSRASLASDWVQDEAAHGRDHARLVPLSIDGTQPPLGFRQLQFLDVSGDALRADSPAMRRALAAIARLLDRPVPDPAVEANPAAPGNAAPGARAVNRRALLAAGAGLAVAGVGAGAWWLTRPSASALPNSLAVLPFANLGGDPAQAYLSDGLSAELRAQLSRNPLLSVMGQASSNSVRREDDARAIARRLGVSYLLDGNVRVAGDGVRIAVELIDGGSGFTRWSDGFSGGLDDVLGFQQQVAGAVDAALAARLADPAAEARTRAGGSNDGHAFDAFLKGRALFESQHDEASDRAALAQFDAAIAVDPAYAAARAARSRTLAVIANQYAADAGARRSLYADAVAEAERAVRAAPDLADGYAALGYASFYGQLDVLAADAPYARAAALGFGSADVLRRCALYRARRRQFDQARPAIARALALDPLNASVFNTDGLIRSAAGDQAGAIRSARKALAISPDRATLHGDIGNALVLLGRLDEAEAAFARERSDLLAIPGRAFVALRRGQAGAGPAAVAALERAFGDNGFYQQAQVLAQAGEPAAALTRLEQARAVGDSGLVSLLVDPFLAPLRGQAGYAALVRALHFVRRSGEQGRT